ncbi:hypothetical protein CL8F765_20460 [Escherichia coli]|nr:hypothetical protein BFL22_11555 [Escherichia coli]EGD66282.1 hypothetical protein ECF_02874 [Escherichia coli O157:H7 str. 1125]EIP68134.1 hypothetical protein ECEC1734_2257 [Escherichia coli EC1734]ERC36887.1 hypothetical protein QYI_2252 [Escherichia coli B7-2]ERC46300.1 hypothetical protein S1E_2211 [Escherichia coli B94]
MTIIETEGFFNLASAPAVTLNEPFGLFFSAWGMLVPVRFECVKTPSAPAGKDGRIIRIV